MHVLPFHSLAFVCQVAHLDIDPVHHFILELINDHERPLSLSHALLSVQYDQDIVDLLASLKPGSVTNDGGLYAAAMPPPPSPTQDAEPAMETSEVGVHCKA